MAPLPFVPAPAVAAALKRAGIGRLYSHQAHALEIAANRQPVLVATPTASGKSLVYNLTVLQACAERPESRALYIFPFKALEQDQKAAFEALAAAFPAQERPRCAIYDGDTPAGLRRKIKADPPHVLITNPDMLHLGILAHHGDWAGFLFLGDGTTISYFGFSVSGTVTITSSSAELVEGTYDFQVSDGGQPPVVATVTGTFSAVSGVVNLPASKIQRRSSAFSPQP